MGLVVHATSKVKAPSSCSEKGLFNKTGSSSDFRSRFQMVCFSSAGEGDFAEGRRSAAAPFLTGSTRQTRLAVV